MDLILGKILCFIIFSSYNNIFLKASFVLILLVFDQSDIICLNVIQQSIGLVFVAFSATHLFYIYLFKEIISSNSKFSTMHVS